MNEELKEKLKYFTLTDEQITGVENLGVTTAEDMKYIDTNDLTNLGIKVVTARKIYDYYFAISIPKPDRVFVDLANIDVGTAAAVDLAKQYIYSHNKDFSEEVILNPANQWQNVKPQIIALLRGIVPHVFTGFACYHLETLFGQTPFVAKLFRQLYQPSGAILTYADYLIQQEITREMDPDGSISKQINYLAQLVKSTESERLNWQTNPIVKVEGNINAGSDSNVTLAGGNVNQSINK